MRMHIRIMRASQSGELVLELTRMRARARARAGRCIILTPYVLALLMRRNGFGGSAG
jgi:hypothetical protein